MSSLGLIAIILTRDEEHDLPACLESLKGVADTVYVIDSGSKDRTIEIARQYGARVLEHDFVNYAIQFNWALDQVAGEGKWIMRIDADERLTPELKESLQHKLSTADADVTGISIARRIHFLGRSIRWGDSYPVWLVRVWRAGMGRCEDAWMDEHMVLQSGHVESVPGDLIHDIPKSLSEWTTKHNWYATRECKDILGSASGDAVSGQAGRRRWVKQNLYLKLPLFIRPVLYWAYRYFVKLGFLDGTAGLIYHFLQGFWYRFLVDAKLFELRVRTQPASGVQKSVERLRTSGEKV